MSNAMLDALAATGPAAEHAEQLMLFGQFVGAWEFDVVDHRPDGTTEAGTGEWLFGWVLAGRAVQDVWIVPSREEQRRTGAAPREYGSTVRFYDPGIDAWRIVWNGPVNGRQAVFVADRRGDEIVLEMQGGAERTRWIFSEVEPQSFRWRAVTAPDGSDWALVQEMRVRRRE